MDPHSLQPPASCRRGPAVVEAGDGGGDGGLGCALGHQVREEAGPHGQQI
jgi:hypothetical protein